MPIPANMMSVLHGNGAIAHQAHTQIRRSNISFGTHLGRMIVHRMTDEPGPFASASARKILRLPKFDAVK